MGLDSLLNEKINVAAKYNATHYLWGEASACL